MSAATARRGGTAGAVVVGADYRGLGVVRSLGRHGVPVLVLKHGDDRLAAASRYADSTTFPDGGDGERVQFLLDLCERRGLDGWALFPTGDETAALVARNHDVLGERFRLTTPAWDVLRWVYDKRLTHQLADEVGVPRPATYAVEDAESLGYPVLLKPAVKEGFNAFTAAKAWRIDSADELRARHAEACTLVDPDVVLVQELIPGGGDAQWSYAALCENGRPLASITARRVRQYPMDFGRASTFVETHADEVVDERSRALLERLSYTGLVELEFKGDKLLDINPRVWGWHTLGARAGVDFAYLNWRWLNGERVPPLRARTGVRWMRFSTDLPTALREIRGGRLSPREYLRSLRRPRESAIFAFDDPLPGLAELPLLALVAGRRLLRGAPV